MISFDSKICSDLAASADREWLETNGLGGFASSTITGMNTRRYHGLLVASAIPPTSRFVLLSKLEETLILNGERFELATNRYAPGVIHPQGFKFQISFRLDPFPVTMFRIGEVALVKTLFMLHGENTTVVRYRLQASASCRATLEVRPLIAFRDYHSLIGEKRDALIKVEIEDKLLRVSSPASEAPALLLAHDAAHVSAESLWYRGFEYTEEQKRGFDFHEDLFNLCTLQFEFQAGETKSIIASTEQHEAGEAAAFEEREQSRRSSLVTRASLKDDYLLALLAAADQFIVHRAPDGCSLIAGYHWFTDWGRDTMIAFTGLTLATKQFHAAKKILLTFAAHLSEGMIPNSFPDGGGEPSYNTVDATLWFVHAAGELMRRTDEPFVREHLYSSLKEIINWHEHGTRYGIRVEADGLLRAGEPGVQLTWMDAKVEGRVITPREGKAVEVQALWYNALRIVEDMAKRFGDEPIRAQCHELAEAAHNSFSEKFWNEEYKCLFDVLRDDETADDAIRPNQIFAISLPHPILTNETRARHVIEIVERELLTPYGLRSLSPHHPDYQGQYGGSPLARDSAYHQGTVWAWLIGPFITAYLKVHERSPEKIHAAQGFTEAFRQHLLVAGLGQVSEIFDGDPPHTPRGAIAQGWSVAELLRCELEEFSSDKKENSDVPLYSNKQS